MRQGSLRYPPPPLHKLLVLFLAALGCTVPNPNKRHRDAGTDATVDAPMDGSVAPTCTANEALRCDDTKLVSCNADGTGEVSESCPFGCNPTDKRCAAKPGPVCTANQGLRCDGASLVRCNATGTSEVTEPCALGCLAIERKCADVSPSNGLGAFLDQTSGQPDLNLGDVATINTDTGAVTVGGVAVNVKSDTRAQSGAPTIRVFMVRSLTANNVNVTGTNAVAIVSNGDITINGVLEASGKEKSPGAGAFSDRSCAGGEDVSTNTLVPGAGGGGFGGPGGAGGGVKGAAGSLSGGAGGGVVGNAALAPLRGGCNGGRGTNLSFAGGGGAIQLVSRTRIAINGAVAANGNSGTSGGGSSGGGILLEAPVVDATGNVVANGGAGLGCKIGPEPGLNDVPAAGTPGCQVFLLATGSGGNGGAGNSAATSGGSIDLGQSPFVGVGGTGGGGVGRIRVNAADGGRRGAGVFSPAASQGTLATR